MKKNKMCAFTLAEVLITLAIIGVVAALTIPSVVTNYRKNLYVTQLKKEYSYMTNGLRGAMAKDGVTQLSDTGLWSKMPDRAYPSHLTTYYSDFRDEFSKIFNVAEIYDGSIKKIPTEDNRVVYKYLSGNIREWKTRFVCLNDGACFDFIFDKTPRNSWCGDNRCTSLKEFQENRNTPTKFWQNNGQIEIDVNGFRKGPNQLGRDYFLFNLGNDGILYPYLGIEDAIRDYGYYSDIVDNTHTTYWKYNNNQWCSTVREGYGCAARIIEEGWKMNY